LSWRRKMTAYSEVRHFGEELTTFRGLITNAATPVDWLPVEQADRLPWREIRLLHDQVRSPCPAWQLHPYRLFVCRLAGRWPELPGTTHVGQVWKILEKLPLTRGTWLAVAITANFLVSEGNKGWLESCLAFDFDLILI
jgi:hypothetical protein